MRYFVDKPAVKRINGGGRYEEEWFDVKLEVNYESVMELADSTSDSKNKATDFAFKQLVAWSLADSSGTPLTITKEAFTHLPFELVQPLFVFLNDPDFLAQALPAQKAEKS